MTAGLITEEFARALAEELRESKSERRRLAQMLASGRGQGPEENTEIIVRNNGATTIPAYSFISLNPAINGLSGEANIMASPAAWPAYRPDAIVMAVNSTSYHGTAVTLDSIAPGGIGRVAVSGIVPVRCWKYPAYTEESLAGLAYSVYRGVIQSRGELIGRLCEAGPHKLVGYMDDPNDSSYYLAWIDLNAGEDSFGADYIAGSAPGSLSTPHLDDGIKTLANNTTNWYGFNNFDTNDAGMTIIRRNRCQIVSPSVSGVSTIKRLSTDSSRTFSTNTTTLGAKAYYNAVSISAEFSVDLNCRDLTLDLVSEYAYAPVVALWWAKFTAGSVQDVPGAAGDYLSEHGTCDYAYWNFGTRKYTIGGTDYYFSYGDNSATQRLTIRYDGKLNYDEQIVPVIGFVSGNVANIRTTNIHFRFEEILRHVNQTSPNGNGIPQ